MTDEEIKKRLGQYLGVNPLPDALWETLEDDLQKDLDRARDLRKPEGDAWEDIEYDAWLAWRTIRRALKANRGDSSFGTVRKSSPNRGLQGRTNLLENAPDPGYEESWRDFTPQEAGEEREQAKALGDYMALCASLNVGVREFRREVLGGDVLSPGQAHEFVDSLANQWFGQDNFEEWGVTPTNHCAVFVSVNYPDFDTGGECAILEPIGQQVFIPDDEMDQRFAGYLYFPPRSGEFIGEPRQIPVGSGSILDGLMQLSEELTAAVCSSWNQAQTSWFVLTGEATPAAVLIARSNWRADHGFDRYGWYGSRAITLTAEPWVSADEVAKAYRAVQKGALERQRNRESPEANRALFKFVIEHLRAALPAEELSQKDWLAFAYVVRLVNGDEDPQDGLPPGTESARPSWRKLRQEWNGWYEDEASHYKEDGNFRRAFLSTARRIVPRIQSPYSEVTPPNYSLIRASRLRRRRRRK
jgi:hypothetical protein